MKNEVIHARVSEEEKKQIEKMIIEGGYGNVTNLIRSVLFGIKEVPKKRIGKKGMAKQYSVDKEGKVIVKHNRSEQYIPCNWGTYNWGEEGIILYESIIKFDWLIWKLANQGIRGKNLKNGKFFYRTREVEDYCHVCTWGEMVEVNWGKKSHVYLRFKDDTEFIIPKVVLMVKL